MAPIVTTARLVCKSKEARVKVLEAFYKIVKYSQANEPGVTRYIATVPIDDALDTEIYMIEEYTSEEANASHIAAPPVQELISLFGTADVLDSAPEVYNNNIVVQKAVTGDLDISSGTAIVLAHYEYPPGALSRALEGWKDVVRQIEESENGTRAYTVLATEGVNDVRTVEIYESWDYLQDAHLKDSKVKAHAPKSSVRLRCVHGFFGGGRTCSKI